MSTYDPSRPPLLPPEYYSTSAPMVYVGNATAGTSCPTGWVRLDWYAPKPPSDDDDGLAGVPAPR